MGRPSKLTDAQWDTLKQRLIAGEKAADLSREYGVSKSAISGRVSKRAETINTVANQIVAADKALKELPLTEQVMTLSLVDELKSISTHMAGAGKFSAASAHRLAGIAHDQVQKIDDAQPELSMAAMQRFSAMTKLANEASHIPLNLLAANKDAVKLIQKDAPVLPVRVVIQVEDASQPEAQ
jgi:hypothetical protein